ncbi:MAG: protein kinase [Proteobacteria bacterium]|nr:protein kinase [Pseudomonadota bacterium]
MAYSQDRHVMELFDHAADLASREQTQFLAKLPTGLRDRLRALLAADREPLDRRLRIVEVARKLFANASTARLAEEALPCPEGTIGQWEVIREIGRGGMGAVYLARDTKLGRKVAIKFLLSRDRSMTDRFVAEAQTLAQCTHENIVTIHDVDEHRGHPFMVLEYIQGQSLRQLLEKQKLAPHRAVEIMSKVLSALVRIHEMGIVHRDLKPENVMLTDKGTVKVLDFGIAKILTGSDSLEPNVDRASEAAIVIAQRFAHTRTGTLLGTLPYMSPEHLKAETLDHRTDIWAVGIMLCEMVTGQHPLAPLSANKCLEVADMDRPMPSMGELAPQLEKLGPIIDRSLIKDPCHRTQTARELLADLEGLFARGSNGQLAADQNPFAGLEAFQEVDADRFYGRDSDIASMVARLRTYPLVTIVGPSGNGKSSLVRAGVIPALKRSGEGWISLVARPGRHPVAALASMLSQFLVRSNGWTVDRLGDSPIDRDALAERLRAEPGYLGTELRAHANMKRTRIVLFVDQFEELYTLGAKLEERAAFVRCLEGVADDAASPLRVVLSMRSDFLDRVAEDREFMAEVTRGLVLLPPMSRKGLRETLTRPVEAAGYNFESSQLVAIMLDALEATRGALPLLQFTAAKLWDSRDRDRYLLTRASYEEIGGISGTLARHADAVLSSMTPPRQALARSVFERLVTPERTRAIAALSELRELSGDSDAIEQVVHHLAAERLLAIETGTDCQGSTVELIHESLIDDWPSLRRWLDDSHKDAEFLTQLRVASELWARNDKSDDTLWRGVLASQARHWRDRYDRPLATREASFLNAVFAQAQRTTRFKRVVIAGTMVFLLALAVAVAASVALVKIRAANAKVKQNARELSEQLTVNQRLSAARQQALEQEKTARQKAQQARREAEEAKSIAEVEAENSRRAERTTGGALDQARRSEARARRAEADARAAEAQLRIERDKARQAAERERRAKQVLDRIIERANNGRLDGTIKDLGGQSESSP